jgi:hypothetical protein
LNAAFLVLMAKRRASLARRHVDLVEAPRLRGLGFDAVGHRLWQDDAGDLVLGAWHSSGDEPADVAWYADPQRAVLCIGHPRWRGRPWRSNRLLASQVASALEHEPLTGVASSLGGFYAVVELTRAGHGIALSDPLGFRCVYYGENDDVVAISSRAALVAEALTRAGERPTRDPECVSWQAFTTYLVGGSTGYNDVHVAPSGGSVILRPDASLIVAKTAPWLPGDGERKPELDEVVERVTADISETLRAVLDVPASRHVVGLTGGKDSRVLLAVALASGLADRFDFETIGPPALADVQVAEELAEAFGLRHETKFFGMRPPEPYDERIRSFIADTAGMVNLWDIEAASPVRDEIRVTGLCGEILRTFRPNKTVIGSTTDLLEEFRPQLLTRLGLLEPELAAKLRERAISELFDVAGATAKPHELFDSFYPRTRMRFSRIGPREEVTKDHRIAPLYSIDAIRAAFSLGGPARRDELLHFEIIRRSSPQLARHRFAGPGWNEATAARLSPRSLADEPSPRVKAKPSTGDKAESLMQRVQGKSSPERTNVYRAVLSDRQSAAWSFLDRAKAISALDRFETLNATERRELCGAITAVLWLDDELTPI